MSVLDLPRPPGLAMSILDGLRLNPEQLRAATYPGDVVVTAGPGSGKTLTLVGRYLWLVEKGVPLPAVVAVTFTQKAGREMRNRVRRAIREHLAGAADAAARAFWQERYLELDAAPIGTIHALCSRILRLHPAEAGLDPDFEVLEEGAALALRAQALEEALAWAANDPQASRLFGALEESALRQTLGVLLSLPLEAREAFEAMGEDILGHWRSIFGPWLETRLSHRPWLEALEMLASVSALNPLDTLERKRVALLAAWQGVRAGQAAGDWPVVLDGLLTLRGCLAAHLGAAGQWSGSQLGEARRAMRVLKTLYEAALDPFFGSRPPSARLDEALAGLVPALGTTFEQALAVYEGLKDGRVDFDDLEGRAVGLLGERRDIRQLWQSRIQALLVDEFQDTNRRQYRLIELLARPGAGRLFIVGDDQQSIYRFRGADVTVFRGVRDRLVAFHQVLDLSYRGHRELIRLLNDLVRPALGTETDRRRPYATAFGRLRASRDEPLPWAGEPFVELHLGVGETAEDGRRWAAGALAHRLWGLHQAGMGWGEAALLFRSSSHFGEWEDALDAAGIPFVTVAGRGFYERPEVRDVLNALVALADPWDDLALTGVLRSPVFGVSDAGIYRLRWGRDGKAPRSLWQALAEGAGPLKEPDQSRALRAHTVVDRLQALSGRVPVADLIKLYLEETYYPALLNLSPATARAGRNLDKLVQDALGSGLGGVRAFLQYVDTLRDVGVREGEAPAEAGNAVQLMTVHKAKGLEFPLVVMADAGHRRWSRSRTIVHPQWGVTVPLDDGESTSAFYRWTAFQDEDQEAEEEKRLLYVAATRARDKLLLSGHVRLKNDGRLWLDGWLAALGGQISLDRLALSAGSANLGQGPQAGQRALSLPGWGERVGCTFYEAPPPLRQEGQTAPGAGEPFEASLPLADPLPFAPGEADGRLPRRTWRVVPRGARPRAPHWVVGRLVHHALGHDVWPETEGIEHLLKPALWNMGLVDPGETRDAIRTTIKLLRRLSRQPLRQEIELAEARYHELPYTYTQDSGIIDLLYRRGGRWEVLEFKTNELRTEAALVAAIEEYRPQAQRYSDAIEALMGERPRVRLCFLDYKEGAKRKVRLEEVALP